MSIVASEIVWRTSVEMSDAGTNGGKMTATAIANAVKNNLWPDVPQSERTAGSLKYRKAHIHIANDADLTLVQARVFVETATPGDDSVVIFAGTHTNTQSSITGSERKYGGGQLNTNATASDTSIEVAVDTASDESAASLALFQNGDLIRISDKTSVDDVGGAEEYATISGVPSYGGNVVTIPLASGIQNSYSSANTRVSSVYEVGDVAASYVSFAVTSAGGTYDDTTYPMAVDHIGGVEANWSLTFTNATTFNIFKDAVNIGSGNVSADVQPTNTDFSKPYFVLDSAGFGGTFQAGDTITFTTHPASIPLWYRRKVPAGASSLSGNKVIIGVDGQSS
jgi:hypothetical protein